jgi:hypothetical protein
MAASPLPLARAELVAVEMVGSGPRAGGRKLVTLPSRETGAIRRWDGEPTPLQLTLASGHRWLATRESGEIQSLREIARREGVDSSFVNRMVNLTTWLDIVLAVFDETLPPDLTHFELPMTGGHCGTKNGTELRA